MTRPRRPAVAGRAPGLAPTWGDPAPPACVPAPGGGCSLCGDEALEALVLARDAGAETARVRMEGAERDVDVALVPDAAPGDRLVVHLGFAIGRLSPEPTPRRIAEEAS